MSFIPSSYFGSCTKLQCSPSPSQTPGLPRLQMSLLELGCSCAKTHLSASRRTLNCAKALLTNKKVSHNPWLPISRAGLLEALHNETPCAEPVSSPTSKLHAAYEPISEAELLADGLIEPVSAALSELFIL